MPLLTFNTAVLRKRLCLATAGLVLVAGAESVRAQAPSSATQEGRTNPPSKTQSSKARGSNARGSNAQGSNAQGSNAQGSNAQSTNAQSTNAQSTNAQSTNAQSTNAQSTNAQSSGAQSSGAQSSDSRASGPSPSSGIAKGDASMMREVMQAHLAEIKMAALATAISQDPEVRAFGVLMLEEHYEAKNRLQQIADAGGAILPYGVNQQQAQMLHELARMTGAEFNRAYLSLAGMELHQQSRDLMQRMGSEAQDQRLKQYAAMYQPMPDKHLNLAKQVMEKPRPTASSGK
jgi:putative membrane protein